MDNRPSRWRKKMDLDKNKIERFRSKVELMKSENKDQDDSEKLRILQEALKELNIIDEPVTNHYEIGDAIGSGKYGLVKEAVAIRNPDLKVAIKTINLGNISSKYHIIAQEILTMKRIDHPNIVKMYEIYREFDKLHLVMEYIEGKELFDFIFERNRLNESEAAYIVKQLLQCLNYLNSMNI